MTNLYIIGNGFDLAHKMKTSYCDFRNFLLEQGVLDNKDYSDDMFREIPEYSIGKDGEDVFNDTEVIRTIIMCIDDSEHNLWKNIETSLGEINYSSFFQTYGLYDGEEINQEYIRNEDNAINFRKVLRQLHNYFYDWLDTIEPAKEPLDDFERIIDKQNDLFLSFNYTKTLQDLYNVENICHIHGSIGDKKIYLGHNADKFDDEYYDIHCFGAKDILKELHQDLRKNTQEAYNNNKVFFETITKVAKQDKFNIYSFGFSYSDVDEFYLKEIFRNIDTSKVCLYMNDYKYDDIEKFKQTALKCGFKGKFSTFHVETPSIYPFRQGLFKNYQYTK